MTVPGALPPDLFTALAALFLLLGVPLILFVLIMLYTGYVRYDAEQYLEELEKQEAERNGREHGSDGAERVPPEERSESASTRDDRPTDRHSPATSEEGVPDGSDDASTDFVDEDDPRSP